MTDEELHKLLESFYLKCGNGNITDIDSLISAYPDELLTELVLRNGIGSAIQNNQRPVIDFLLSTSISIINNDAFYHFIAQSLGNKELVQYFLTRPNTFVDLRRAANLIRIYRIIFENGLIEIFRYLFEDFYGCWSDQENNFDPTTLNHICLKRLTLSIIDELSFTFHLRQQIEFFQKLSDSTNEHLEQIDHLWLEVISIENMFKEDFEPLFRTLEYLAAVFYGISVNMLEGPERAFNVSLHSKHKSRNVMFDKLELLLSMFFGEWILIEPPEKLLKFDFPHSLNVQVDSIRKYRKVLMRSLCKAEVPHDTWYEDYFIPLFCNQDHRNALAELYGTPDAPDDPPELVWSMKEIKNLLSPKNTPSEEFVTASKKRRGKI